MKIVFDGMNIAHRCHVIYDKKQGLASSDGFPTGTVYGFLRTLIKWKEEYPQASFHIAWDAPGSREKRQEKFSDYKSNRSYSRTDEYRFSEQLSLLRSKILPALGVSQYYSFGHEADDVIATLIDEWDDSAIIVSTDRDFLQLVDYSTVLITPDRDKKYDRDKVEEEYDIDPDWIVSFRALNGDSSDNLPGLPYFRKKIIAKLLEEYDGDLESLYEGGLPDHLTDKESSKLEDFEDQAFLNFELMNLTPIESYGEIETDKDPDKVSTIFDQLEFKSLEEVEKFFDKDGFMKIG